MLQPSDVSVMLCRWLRVWLTLAGSCTTQQPLVTLLLVHDAKHTSQISHCQQECQPLAGLSPDIMKFDGATWLAEEPTNRLRPEAVEASLRFARQQRVPQR